MKFLNKDIMLPAAIMVFVLFMMMKYTTPDQKKEKYMMPGCGCGR